MTPPGSVRIYAVFSIEADKGYSGRNWDGRLLVAAIKEFEARRSYRDKRFSDRRMADPRVMSLRELLTAMK
jgi:hypothetical protein